MRLEKLPRGGPAEVDSLRRRRRVATAQGEWICHVGRVARSGAGCSGLELGRGCAFWGGSARRAERKGLRRIRGMPRFGVASSSSAAGKLKSRMVDPLFLLRFFLAAFFLRI